MKQRKADAFSFSLSRLKLRKIFFEAFLVTSKKKYNVVLPRPFFLNSETEKVSLRAVKNQLSESFRFA